MMRFIKRLIESFSVKRPVLSSEEDIENYIASLPPRPPFINADEDQIWPIIEGPLSPYLDDAEDTLDRLCRRTKYGQPPTRYPIWVVAKFYSDMKPHLPTELHEIIDSYVVLWSRGGSVKTLKQLRRTRQSMFGNDPRMNTLLKQMRFLDTDTEWETQQDGVFFYICWDFCEAGIDPKAIRAALCTVIDQNSR